MAVSVQRVAMLRLIAGGPVCGADIMRELGLASGFVYPCLADLELAGFIAGAWEPGDPKVLGRPLRRHYTITDAGAAYVAALVLMVTS